MNHGEAPLGPIEYVQGTIEYGLRREAPVATSISMAGGVCELHLALALGPDAIDRPGDRAVEEHLAELRLAGHLADWTDGHARLNHGRQ